MSINTLKRTPCFVCIVVIWWQVALLPLYTIMAALLAQKSIFNWTMSVSISPALIKVPIAFPFNCLVYFKSLLWQPLFTLRCLWCSKLFHQKLNIVFVSSPVCTDLNYLLLTLFFTEVILSRKQFCRIQIFKIKYVSRPK